jgi:sphingosine kinase
MVKTKYRGEAVEIAERLVIEAYDMVASCSGDGLPYEVFNGLGKRADAKRALSKIAVVHIPCGSGNAMSCNLNGTDSASMATLAIIKGIPTPLDLVSITQGDTRTLSFLSQSVGIVAESDLATEHLRWLGSARFTYGFLVRLLGKTVYPCDIAVKVAIEDKLSIKDHYKRELDNHESASERRGYKNLVDDDASQSSGNDEGLPPLKYGTINDKLPEGWELVPYDKLGNFYCGNMAYMASDANFFSSALPNDGFMDLVCINGDISRLSALNMLSAVDNGKFFDMPLVSYRKIFGYRIIPKNQGDGYISIDGERVPFQPFQAEVHKGLGTVLSKTGHIYEAPGPL